MKREPFSTPSALVLCALALLPLSAACSDDGSETTSEAKVQVQMTDASSDFISKADVWVSRVYLQGGPGHATDTTDASTSGRVDLFNKPSAPFHADLLALRAGVVVNLTDSVSIDSGDYRQLRIVVDSAKVTLKAGFLFVGGSATATLKIPSGSTSGIKVQLTKDLESNDGEVNTILVDFDTNDSFVMQGSASPFTGVTFSPVIKEKSRASAVIK